MSINNEQPRRHPDLFTEDEAVEYLRLKSERSLETIDKHYGLKPLCLGKDPVYHREDLDRVVEKAVKREENPTGRGNGKLTKLN